MEGIPQVTLEVFFSAVTLILGSLVRELGARVGLPYGPLALGCGMLLGTLDEQAGVLGKAVHSVRGMNPFDVLTWFLPLIVFKTSMDLDWSIFRKQMGQALLLAYPGVLISAALLAIYLRTAGAQFLQLDWPDSLLFGLALSCTDTSAFLKKLKGLGAPLKMSTMIKGESLLNDSSSVLMFLLILRSKGGSPVTVIPELVAMFMGGILLGFIVGLLAGWWMSSNKNDEVQVVNSLFVGVLLIRFMCQDQLWGEGIRPSALVAVTVFGLKMAADGKGRLSFQSLKAATIFWKYAEFASQTLIYLLSGVIIRSDLKSLEGNEYLFVLGLYLLGMASRLLSIAALLRPLRRLGHQFGGMDWLLLGLGGERGAVTLTLSLVLTRHRDGSNELVICAFGVVVLSVLVNGNLIGWLIRKSKAAQSSRFRTIHLVAVIQKTVQNLKRQALAHGLSEQLLGITPLQGLLEAKRNSLQQNLESPLRKGAATELQKAISEHTGQELGESLLGGEWEQGMCEVRVKLLQSFKSILFQFKRENKICYQSWQVLQEAISIDLDQPFENVSSFDWIEEQLSDSPLRYLLQLSEVPLLGPFLQGLVLRKLTVEYQVVAAYIDMVGLLLSRKSDILPSKCMLEANSVLGEYSEQRRLASDYLDNLRSLYPVLSLQAQTKLAAHLLLQRLDSYFSLYAQSGQFNDRQFQFISQRLKDAAQRIEKFNPSLRDLSITQFVRHAPPFNMLPERLLRVFVNELTLRTYDTRQVVFKEGKRSRSLYLVVRGTGQLLINQGQGDFRLKKRSQQFAGVQSLMGTHYFSSLTSIDLFYALKIPAISVLSLFATFPAIEKEFWLINLNDFLWLGGIQADEQALRERLARSEFRKLQQGSTTCLPLLLVRGVLRTRGEQVERALLLCDSSKEAVKDCYVFQMSSE